jgi:hypothetical protein
MQETRPFPRRRWLRITLQVILALITFALVFLIMLPAFVSLKR